MVSRGIHRAGVDRWLQESVFFRVHDVPVHTSCALASMIGGVAPAPHLFCFTSAGNGETPHPNYTTTRQESHHAKAHKNYTPVDQAADGGQ